MKKLPALFVISIMLGICASSYGYFLIYKLSGTINGTDGTVAIKKVTIPFKGYLVMDFNDANSLIDANMIICNRDPNKHNVYVQLNVSDGNEFLDPYTVEWGDKRYFYGLNGKSPFDFKSFMMGDVKSVNIGLKNSVPIASNLKGFITGEEGMFLDPNQKIACTGSISASLWGLATRGVNDFNNGDSYTPHTQEDIIDALKGIGVYSHHPDWSHPLQHYVEVNIPATPPP